MELSAGNQLGPYTILAAAGAGGMGEVYRARDERLQRDVALKVLKGDAVADPDRQRRFAQEARAVSALNHPNILIVYDVGISGSIPFLVTEWIEGESLRDLIRKGPIPLKRALELAVQISDGLAAAHGAGILHRDLKPANVMVGKDGRAKILDFGLAKPVEGKWKTTDTAPGLIMGTASYMSPEQARGEPLDIRSDQFSFGLIAYEMLTGKAAFDRGTAMETLAAILQQDPEPLSKAVPSLPVPLRWAVERCLDKDRERRYAATHDLVHDLRNIRENLGELSGPQSVALEAPPPKRRSFAAAWAAAVILALAGGVAAGRYLLPSGGLDLSKYQVLPVATDGSYEGSPAWSADGRTLAYIGDVGGIRQVFVRNLDSPMAAQVTRSTSDCTDPFWAPDGSRVYFLSDRNGAMALWKVSPVGGTPELVQEDVASATISPDGQSLFFLRFDPAGAEPLRLWSIRGGTPRRIDRAPFNSKKHRSGYIGLTADGKSLGAWLSNWDGRSEFWTLPLPDGDPHLAFTLLESAHPFQWLPDNGRILFGGVMPGTVGSDLHIADVSSGKVWPITKTSSEAILPAVSPDGKRIAFTVAQTNTDLMEIPLDGSEPRVLQASSRNESDPASSPVNDQITYATDRSGTSQIWIKSTHEEMDRPLITEKDFNQTWILGMRDLVFSPDGQRLAYSVIGSNGHAVYVSNIRGGPPQRLVQDGSDQRFPTWSPDGRTIAFARNSEGRWELMKVDSGGGTPSRISDLPAAAAPEWSPAGERIGFASTSGLVLVSPDGSGKQPLGSGHWLAYGWTKDGNQLIGIRSEADRRRTVVSLQVSTGTEKILRDLPYSSSAVIEGLSLMPGGGSFATSIGQHRGDIWLLEGFALP